MWILLEWQESCVDSRVITGVGGRLAATRKKEELQERNKSCRGRVWRPVFPGLPRARRTLSLPP